jgi:hypothetical protein
VLGIEFYCIFEAESYTTILTFFSRILISKLMKTNILSPIFFGSDGFAVIILLKAQMYVGGNSYVYAKNTRFIKQDLELVICF